MNYHFLTPGIGRCSARIRVRGAYGFSVPKTVEVVTPGGLTSTYLYRNVNEMDGVQLNAKTIARIAIFHFLNNPAAHGATTELDSNMPMYDGKLMRVIP